MMSPPTPDTQAVLLLCARLGQHDDASAKPLDVRQLKALALWLEQHSLHPGDLLQNKGRAMLAELDAPGISRDIVERLLDRGAALALLTESWINRGLWVLGRSDAAYPARYKTYLQHAAPPLLYGVGDQAALQDGGLAIVGSRDAGEEDLQFARDVVAACCRQKLTVISGAAKGIDSEAMMASLDHGGKAIGVLAEGLGRASIASQYHDALVEGRLTLVSSFEPESRWFAFKAMDRNKLIYALGDAALVVCSLDDKGGTWTGATEALRQDRVPIWVKATGTVPAGNRKLLRAGARPFSLEKPCDNLARLLQEPAPTALPLLQDQIFVNDSSKTEEPVIQEQNNGKPIPIRTASEPGQQQADTDAYAHVIPLILDALTEPQDEKSLAAALNILPGQAKAWLKRAANEGKVRKIGKPVRYVAVKGAMPLFQEEAGV